MPFRIRHSAGTTYFLGVLSAVEIGHASRRADLNYPPGSQRTETPREHFTLNTDQAPSKFEHKGRTHEQAAVRASQDDGMLNRCISHF